ncbi:24019_t:CDS:2, partial [Dentiscutata erythropus]
LPNYLHQPCCNKPSLTVTFEGSNIYGLPYYEIEKVGYVYFSSVTEAYNFFINMKDKSYPSPQKINDVVTFKASFYPNVNNENLIETVSFIPYGVQELSDCFEISISTPRIIDLKNFSTKIKSDNQNIVISGEFPPQN